MWFFSHQKHLRLSNMCHYVVSVRAQFNFRSSLWSHDVCESSRDLLCLEGYHKIKLYVYNDEFLSLTTEYKALSSKRDGKFIVWSFLTFVCISMIIPQSSNKSYSRLKWCALTKIEGETIIFLSARSFYYASRASSLSVSNRLCDNER